MSTVPYAVPCHPEGAGPHLPRRESSSSHVAFLLALGVVLCLVFWVLETVAGWF